MTHHHTYQPDNSIEASEAHQVGSPIVLPEVNVDAANQQVTIKFSGPSSKPAIGSIVSDGANYDKLVQQLKAMQQLGLASAGTSLALEEAAAKATKAGGRADNSVDSGSWVDRIQQGREQSNDRGAGVIH